MTPRAEILAALIPALLICAAVQAKEKPLNKKVPAETLKLKAETNISTAPRAVEISTQASARQFPEVLDRLRGWDDKLESLTSRFSQTVRFEEAGLDQQVEGRLHYLKPDRLRVEHTRPSRQVIYTDKKTLWIYKPEDSQVIRANWEDWRKNQSSSFSGIMDFGNYSGIIEKHEITSDAVTAGGLIRLKFVPKENPALYTLTLSLSATDYFPVKASLTVGGTTIDTTLEETEKNARVPAEIFDFRPPKGVSVIEFPGGSDGTNK